MPVQAGLVVVTNAAKIVTDTTQKAKQRLANYQLGWEQNQIAFWGQQNQQNTEIIAAQTQGTSDIVATAVGASIANKGQKNKSLVTLSIVGVSVVGLALILTFRKAS